MEEATLVPSTSKLENLPLRNKIKRNFSFLFGVTLTFLVNAKILRPTLAWSQWRLLWASLILSQLMPLYMLEFKLLTALGILNGLTTTEVEISCVSSKNLYRWKSLLLLRELMLLLWRSLGLLCMILKRLVEEILKSMISNGITVTPEVLSADLLRLKISLTLLLVSTKQRPTDSMLELATLVTMDLFLETETEIWEPLLSRWMLLMFLCHLFNALLLSHGLNPKALAPL